MRFPFIILAAITCWATVLCICTAPFSPMMSLACAAIAVASGAFAARVYVHLSGEP